MQTNCKDCKWGDVAMETRTIKTALGNTVITQIGGGVVCICDHVRNITITDGEMVCSNFERREKE